MDVENKILCVGLCCFDIVMLCESYPIEDSDQGCISSKWQRGGNASNNATVFSEFKVPCTFLGSLSTDMMGQFLLEDLKTCGISTAYCPLYTECQSPFSTIFINSQNGSRTIVASKKNLPEVTLADFKKLDLANYRWIHFEGRPNFVEIDSIVHYIREWNNDHQDKIVISVEIEKPRAHFWEMMALADVVFISKEFSIHCGYTDMKSAVNGLYEKLKPEGVLICPWGEQGACTKSGSDIYTSPAFPPSRIVNTLSAGDTFIAATIISLLKGRHLSDAIELGCKVAGTRCGLPDITGLSILCPYL